MLAESGGKVYEGTWNQTTVALKALRTDSGGSPSASVSVYLTTAKQSLIQVQSIFNEVRVSGDFVDSFLQAKADDFLRHG
jgi:hypothetical protein